MSKGRMKTLLASLLCVGGTLVQGPAAYADPPPATPAALAPVSQHAGFGTPATLVSSEGHGSQGGHAATDASCAGGHCDGGLGHDYNWYIGISGGWADRERVTESSASGTFLTFDNGFAVNAALGRRFGAIRAEAEFSLFNNKVDQAGAALDPTQPDVTIFSSPAEGNVTLRAYMFNLYYDVNIKDTGIRPYVGAGVGFYQSEINGLLPQFFGILGLGTQGVNSASDYPFAYQFRAGVSYDCGPRTELFGGYRFFHGDTLTFSAFPFGTFRPRGAELHNIELGLRVKF